MHVSVVLRILCVSFTCLYHRHSIETVVYSPSVQPLIWRLLSASFASVANARLDLHNPARRFRYGVMGRRQGLLRHGRLAGALIVVGLAR
jgi:hypothetical protein